jgi:dCMP deaminase
MNKMVFSCVICGQYADDGDGLNRVCVDCDGYEQLRQAQEFADLRSDCKKVKVGSLIICRGKKYFGANRVIPRGCDRESCNKDGHCVATIHSEIDAIVRAKTDLTNGIIYVTRYPCESCARAIVDAGIKTVIYGRWKKISEDTERIFKENYVRVVHRPAFNPPEGEEQ